MRERSVIEILVITFTFVIGFFIVGLGVLIVVVEVRNPDADTGVIANTLGTMVSGILGALLGLIAGRSATTDTLHRRPTGEDNHIGQTEPDG